MVFLMVYCSKLHQFNLHQLCGLVCLHNFKSVENALLHQGLCLMWLKVKIFSLGAILHYSMISDCLTLRLLQHINLLSQKVVDELWAKGAIELSTIGTGFDSNVFVIPKHTGGLQPIFNLNWFSCCMHIPTFKTTTIRQVWQLIQQGYYTFSVHCRDCLYTLYTYASSSIFTVCLEK